MGKFITVLCAALFLVGCAVRLIPALTSPILGHGISWVPFLVVAGLIGFYKLDSK